MTHIIAILIASRYKYLMTETEQIRALVTRLARLDAAETWEDDLNPVQLAALDYLSRANRFSRAPSHVAAYLGTTRGTMSQTLKVLLRKGYLEETRSEADKRSISYTPTLKGQEAAGRSTALSHAIDGLGKDGKSALWQQLSAVLSAMLVANQGRSFGVCQNCTHYRATGTGGFCNLLKAPLLPDEAQQICHEQVPA